MQDTPSQKGFTTSGCRISGKFPLNKVDGKLNIFPTPTSRMTVMGFPIAVINQAVNFSHKIHKLSFGSDYPGQINPLEGAAENTHEFGFQFNYFVSVVPTIYKGLLGRKISSNQYAVHEFTTQNSRNLPGIFFTYSLEAMSLTVDANRSFIHTFFVRLCGIIGGVYTFSTALYSIVYFFSHRYSKEPNYQLVQ